MADLYGLISVTEGWTAFHGAWAAGSGRDLAGLSAEGRQPFDELLQTAREKVEDLQRRCGLVLQALAAPADTGNGSEGPSAAPTDVPAEECLRLEPTQGTRDGNPARTSVA